MEEDAKLMVFVIVTVVDVFVCGGGQTPKKI